MSTYQVSGSYPPFEYGSAVQWRQATGQILQGSICGFDVVETPEHAASVGLPIHTVTALVEVDSGATIELPLDQIELI